MMEITAIRSKLVREGDDVAAHIASALKTAKMSLMNGDIFVITSKVIAIAQGRTVPESEIPRWMKRESRAVFPGAKKDSMSIAMNGGIFIPAAGIDKSNAPRGMAVLWPMQPSGVALLLRQQLVRYFKLQRLGIIIIDSHCQPLRLGTTGIALAVAGFKPVRDERGSRDLFKKKLKITQVAVADSLATVANLVMGEAAERTPFAVIRGAKKIEFGAFGRIPSVKPQNCIFSGVYKPSVLKMN